MKYQIVQSVEGQFVVTNPTDILAWAEVCGIKVNGFDANKSQREELQGQPKLVGFCGPMWNGNNTIRYEDTETYKQISM
jgi:hypothetical protein